MRLALAVSAALILTACEAQTPPAEQAPAPAAPAYPATQAGAFEAASGTPEDMVRALYAAYAANEPRPEPGREPLYTRTLNALVGEDFRRSNGKPWLKVDPVCDCNGGEVKLSSVSLTQPDRTNATAEVVFTVDGTEKRQTLTLAREATRWRISDVQVAGQPRLSESLFKAIG